MTYLLRDSSQSLIAQIKSQLSIGRMTFHRPIDATVFRSMPGWGIVCKHAAAWSQQTAADVRREAAPCRWASVSFHLSAFYQHIHQDDEPLLIPRGLLVSCSKIFPRVAWGGLGIPPPALFSGRTLLSPKQQWPSMRRCPIGCAGGWSAKDAVG